jgi:two-component system LytT family response regulator
MKYNYVIIEDQIPSIQSLTLFMKEHPEYESKGFAHDVKSGVALILKEKPHLIFMDVELLNEQTGFDLIQDLRKHYHILPDIVIISKHEKYLREAYFQDVLYFLDKPFNPVEIQVALSKFEKSYADKTAFLSVKNNKSNLYIKIHFNEIVYLEADGNYTGIYINQNSKYMASLNLGEIERNLNTKFIQIHRKYIINIDYLKAVNLGEKKAILEWTFNPKQGEENSISKNDKSVVLTIGESYYMKLKNQLNIVKTI